MQAADVLVEILRAEGVRQCFCYPFSALIDPMARAGMRVIVTRQERVAGNMADGVSRSTNAAEIGVVTVQGLAGSENAFAGIAQAYTDSTPLLFLPGHPGTAQIGTVGVFDSERNYAGTTKMAEKVRSGRPQPVMLELPGDVCAADFDGSLDYTPVARMRSAADPGAVREAAERLIAAEPSPTARRSCTTRSIPPT